MLSFKNELYLTELMEKLYSDYKNRENCDWFLRFEANTNIKVHGAVLTTYTDYFDNLEKDATIKDGKLHCVVVMPKEAKVDVFKAIINYFYTGSLTIKANSFHDVYEMAKIMQLDDLIALMNSP